MKLDHVRRLFALLLCCLLLIGTASAQANDAETKIVLSDEGITVDGAAITADEAQAVYAANDIVFYLEGQNFAYGEGEEGDGHSQAEADRHTVVHIAQPGTYRLSGKLSAGQVAVDLGEDAKKDENAVVTLILDGVDISCTVAPADLPLKLVAVSVAAPCASAVTVPSASTRSTPGLSLVSVQPPPALAL